MRFEALLEPTRHRRQYGRSVLVSRLLVTGGRDDDAAPE
jgi:hypothetical protein